MLGLPEVKALQREMIEKLREKMLAGIDEQTPTELVKAFMPGAAQFKSLDALQKFFWQAFAGGGKPSENEKGDR